MQISEFDSFAEEYDELHRANISLSGEKPDFFAEYKIRVLRQLVGNMSGNAFRIIDFGSGIGNSIPYMRQYFPGADLLAADVSQRSLEISQARFPDCARNLLIKQNRIPFEDGSCDIAFSACVFHHIEHAGHVHWLKELRRITKKGGVLSIFEHNPLNPLTVRAVNTCPFDVNAHLIGATKLARSFRVAGWTDLKIRYHIFFPRILAPLRRLEPYISSVPFGAQYSITARQYD